MATGIQAWSTTAGDNASADSGIGWAEGQTPASINNSARAMMAALAAFYDTLGGGTTFGGAANAYTITNPSVGAWSAYAEGLIIGLEANHNNSGAATVNVDGLGAKSIVKGASTAVATGDLVSGAFYLLRYDGTNFQIVGAVGAASFQPLDATLTALAALSWSSGSPVIQFTAADTVSLTLAPSVTSLTASNGTGASTPAATFTNTTDNASVRIARFDGDRATPSANDQAYVSFYMSDAGGTQKEFIRLTTFAAAVTAGAEDARWLIGTLSGGSLTTRLHLSSTEIRPGANDGYALGAAGIAFSDLFLASGAAINFNNGDVTITHSSNQLSVAGGDFQANLPLSSETSGSLTVASANAHILATDDITLPNSVFAARNITTIDGNGTARAITRGSGVTMYVNGVDSATATLQSNGLMAVYWRTASICILSGNVS